MTSYQIAHILIHLQALNDHSCVNISNYNLRYSNQISSKSKSHQEIVRLHEFSINYQKSNNYGRILH